MRCTLFLVHLPAPPPRKEQCPALSSVYSRLCSCFYRPFTVWVPMATVEAHLADGDTKAGERQGPILGSHDQS